MVPMNTSSYSFGLASLFPEECFGDEVTSAHCPLPTTEADNSGKRETILSTVPVYLQVDTINRAAQLLRESFAFADLVNVRTCVGAESTTKK
jgi:hypothetical protein